MTDALLILAVLLSLVTIVLMLVLLRRAIGDAGALRTLLETAEKSHERTERAVREEIARSREESAGSARQLREEVIASLKAFNDTLLKQMAALTDTNEKRLEGLRATIDGRLKQIQDDNTAKLEQMRATVDEKLQGTLEKRLGESFKQVSERLEQVHKGLGEMQNLATGVGDLKRVLTNVKTRGTWGEIQLQALLEQLLTREQYDVNVATKDDRERVEFAIRLPGRGEDRREIVWLPIDSKFPQEDYQRLLDAQEQADPEAAESAGKQLEASIRKCAKDICDKYISPPRTTDFGIMFLPTEGLYAEVVRRVGLIEIIQRENRIVVAGPSTLAALLNSLQMGFKTLAIQQRSSEVWNLLGAVRTEFGKFHGILDSVHKKLQQASNTIESAARKSRTIERRLRGVQELPAAESAQLLPGIEIEEEDEADGAADATAS